MSLVSLIFESDAAEEAKSLGLEKKPGFGNYGPVGQETVTHQSREGKLVPVAVKRVTEPKEPTKEPPKTTSGKKERTDRRKRDENPKKTPEPRRLPITKVGSQRRRSAQKAGGARKVEDLVYRPPVPKFMGAVTPMGKIKGPRHISDHVQAALGRVSPISAVYMTNTGVPKVFEDYVRREEAGSPVSHGVYSATNDAIWYSTPIRKLLREGASTPYAEWTNQHVFAAMVATHETVHSCSPRMKDTVYGILRGPDGDDQYIQGTRVAMSEDTLQLEEGLTDYVAQHLLKGMFGGAGVPEKSMKEKDYLTYAPYVRAIRLMEQYGGFNVEETFSGVTDTAELRKRAREAEDKTLTDLMTRELGVSKGDTAKFLKRVHKWEGRDAPETEDTEYEYAPRYNNKRLMIMDNWFTEVLTDWVNRARNDQYESLPDNIPEALWDVAMN